MRGYDCVVLEGYFRYIQKLTKSLDLKMTEAYVIFSSISFSHSLPLFSAPIPSKSSRVTILKARSVQVDVEHHLNLYHRIVKVHLVFIPVIIIDEFHLVIKSESNHRSDSIRMYSFEYSRRC